MDRLPDFSLDDYGLLLRGLKDRGASFNVLSDLPLFVMSSNMVFLRHDIDCHLLGTGEMAELEAAEGVRSTWYVLMTAPYNPRSRACRPALRRLVELGHEIGLHYDLSTYPVEPEAALAHLRQEAAMLSETAGAPVLTISCHYPHKGLPDPFKSSDEFVHCHDPRYTQDVLYVSDSSRGWRDDNVIRWMHHAHGFQHRGLQLLTHPELWYAGHLRDRLRYCDEVLQPLAVREMNDFVMRELRDIWITHDGARMHDERERAAGRL